MLFQRSIHPVPYFFSSQSISGLVLNQVLRRRERARMCEQITKKMREHRKEKKTKFSKIDDSSSCLVLFTIYFVIFRRISVNYRHSFRENKPKTLVFYDWIRAFWACFHENEGLWIRATWTSLLLLVSQLLLASPRSTLLWPASVLRIHASDQLIRILLFSSLTFKVDGNEKWGGLGRT